MSTNDAQLFPVGSFANVCEQLNDFARSLETDSRFVTVRTGADVRSYAQGWRLEKWVEAKLRNQEAWAVWWLDLGPLDGEWVIESHVAVDPDVFHQEFDPRRAAAVEAIIDLLTVVLADLMSALQDNDAFVHAVAEERF